MSPKKRKNMVDMHKGKSVREALGLSSVSKYRNQLTEVGGVRFASKKESRRWGELVLLEKQGVICDLRRQVTYRLTVNGLLVTRYIADFVYVDVGTNREVVEDAKGVRTEAYKIKRKLILALRGIRIEEV